MRRLPITIIGVLAVAGCRSNKAGQSKVDECGNGTVNVGEECDGADLGGARCEGVGTVGCSEECTLDVTGCAGVVVKCGDGERAGEEQCDGGDLGGESCGTLGLTGGELRCTAGCTFDVSDCSGSSSCPDGTRQYPEECDTGDLAAEDCDSLGFFGGTLACLADCTFDTGGCVSDTTPLCTPVPTAAQVDEEDGPLELTFVCTDRDGDTLSVTDTEAAAAPGGGVTFTDDGPGTALAVTIRLAPDADDAGATGAATFNVSFVVSDPQSHTAAVVQTVTFVNPSPTFSPDPISDLVVTTGTTATLAITFTDPDSDTLAFASSLPPYAGLTSSGNVATVTFAPLGPGDDTGHADAGSVTGDDGQGGMVTASFNAVVNQPPVADAGTDVAGEPGESIVLDGTGSSDPDNDTLTYAWTAVGVAPPLDDPSSPTPALVGGACNESYTYALVVDDGHTPSAPNTVEVVITTVGPYVSIDDCIPGDECGDLTRPWCTIQAGIDAARLHVLPEVYVAAGTYPEDPSVTAAASGNPAILGGYTDLASGARATAPSCDPTAGTGGTVIETSTPLGVEFGVGTTSLFERFCVRASVVGGDLARKANITIRNAAPTLRDNIIDAVAGGAVTDTIGIEVINTTSTSPTLERNVDAPASGRYFGGDGTATSTGILVTGPAALVLRDNQIDGGLGADESAGVVHLGSGSLVANDNTIAGGGGADRSQGVLIRDTSASYNASLERNTIAGGTSPTESIGVTADRLDRLDIDDTNLIRGSSSGTQLAVGLDLIGVNNAQISNDNTIVGGPASGSAFGIRLGSGGSARIAGDNVVRGGVAVAATSPAVTRLAGVSATAINGLQIDSDNVISGADADPLSGALAHGGLVAIGVATSGVPNVVVTGNREILGGSPELPVSSPGAGGYLGAGLVLHNTTRLDVSANQVIQGCSPWCGPGSTPIAGVPTGAGVWVEQSAAVGTKTIANNLVIRGGPTTGGPGNFNNTLTVGIAITGPRSGTGPNVSITGNGTIVGNDAPPSALTTRRSAEAVGVLITNATATLADNLEVYGGRGWAAATGVRLRQDLDTPTSASLTDNAAIIGNPYDNDRASDPFQVRGVEFTQVGTGPSSFAAAGQPTARQTLAGGFARGNAQGRAIGVDLAGLDSASLLYNHIWGGLVPQALEQTGLKLIQIEGACVAEANLVEACGVVDPSSAAHHPDCEPMFARSIGVDLLDGVGQPTFLVNNLIFGGFSNQGASGVHVVDSGTASANVQVHHNYINAQGVLGSGCIAVGPDARAVELASPPGAVSTGAGIGFFNNIIDPGGRTCVRYGVYESQTLVDSFTQLAFAHNLFVQALPGRDSNPVGAMTWAYRESSAVSWCLAGVDTMPPCLNAPTAPTTATGYYGNREGDPEFEGNDVTMSEVPGVLPLSDFHTKAAALQGAALPSAVTQDYEGEARDASAPDIGHDETR